MVNPWQQDHRRVSARKFKVCIVSWIWINQWISISMNYFEYVESKQSTTVFGFGMTVLVLASCSLYIQTYPPSFSNYNFIYSFLFPLFPFLFYLFKNPNPADCWVWVDQSSKTKTMNSQHTGVNGFSFSCFENHRIDALLLRVESQPIIVSPHYVFHCHTHSGSRSVPASTSFSRLLACNHSQVSHSTC